MKDEFKDEFMIDPRTDPLRPARGVLTGIVLMTPAWLFIAWLVLR